jgi:hypothetical protein
MRDNLPIAAVVTLFAYSFSAADATILQFWSHRVRRRGEARAIRLRDMA